MFCHLGLGELLQQPQDFPTGAQVTAGQLTHDVRMAQHLIIVKELLQTPATTPEVINPDGCVYQNHPISFAGRA